MNERDTSFQNFIRKNQHVIAAAKLFIASSSMLVPGNFHFRELIAEGCYSLSYLIGFINQTILDKTIRDMNKSFIHCFRLISLFVSNIEVFIHGAVQTFGTEQQRLFLILIIESTKSLCRLIMIFSQKRTSLLINWSKTGEDEGLDYLTYFAHYKSKYRDILKLQLIEPLRPTSSLFNVDHLNPVHSIFNPNQAIFDAHEKSDPEELYVGRRSGLKIVFSPELKSSFPKKSPEGRTSSNNSTTTIESINSKPSGFDQNPTNTHSVLNKPSDIEKNNDSIEMSESSEKNVLEGSILTPERKQTELFEMGSEEWKKRHFERTLEKTSLSSAASKLRKRNEKYADDQKSVSIDDDVSSKNSAINPVSEPLSMGRREVNLKFPMKVQVEEENNCTSFPSENPFFVPATNGNGLIHDIEDVDGVNKISENQKDYIGPEELIKIGEVLYILRPVVFSFLRYSAYSYSSNNEKTSQNPNKKTENNTKKYINNSLKTQEKNQLNSLLTKVTGYMSNLGINSTFSKVYSILGSLPWAPHELALQALALAISFVLEIVAVQCIIKGLEKARKLAAHQVWCTEMKTCDSSSSVNSGFENSRDFPISSPTNHLISDTVGNISESEEKLKRVETNFNRIISSDYQGERNYHPYDKEISRRKLALFLYFLRSPLFDRSTYPVMKILVGYLKHLPIIGSIPEYALSLLEYVNKTHFYNSNS